MLPPSASGGTATVPAKIVMKGTAQMTLNARWAGLKHSSKAAASGFSRVPTKKPQEMEDIKPIPVLHSPGVSRMNTRLAMEMERRPNVMAALKYERSYQQKSVMQRLGAKARLGFRGGGTVWGSGGIRKWRRGFGRNRGFQWRYGNYVRRRFFGRRGFGGWGGWGFQGRGRGRGFSYGGRGRGRRYMGPGRSIMKISKEDLDKQLDEYMSHSKSQLDSQLDNYMAEVNTLP